MLTYPQWSLVIFTWGQFHRNDINHYNMLQNNIQTHLVNQMCSTRITLVLHTNYSHIFCHVISIHRCRDHFVYVPSKWEKTLQCNVVSHWLAHTQNDPCSCTIGTKMSHNNNLIMSYKKLYGSVIVFCEQLQLMTLICLWIEMEI